MADDYDTFANAELALWPGVSWERGQTTRHRVLMLSYDGKSRRVVYPMSPSDNSGPRNHAQDIRHTLWGMGAQRVKPAKAIRRKERNRQPRDVVAQPVADDGRKSLADALSGLTVPL
jgi:hypothetical protein